MCIKWFQNPTSGVKWAMMFSRFTRHRTRKTPYRVQKNNKTQNFHCSQFFFFLLWSKKLRTTRVKREPKGQRLIYMQGSECGSPETHCHQQCQVWPWALLGPLRSVPWLGCLSKDLPRLAGQIITKECPWIPEPCLGVPPPHSENKWEGKGLHYLLLKQKALFLEGLKCPNGLEQ